MLISRIISPAGQPTNKTPRETPAYRPTSGKSGFTLMEMIVVLGSFAILAIISTATLFITLNNMAKARVTREVRRNGDSALQVMERQLRVAQAITACNPTGTEVDFTDQYGNNNSSTNAPKFICDSTTPNKFFIASGSAHVRLTDENRVTVISCNNVFTCDPANNPPQWVKINFTLKSNVNPASTRPTEQGQATWNSQVNIRYQ